MLPAPFYGEVPDDIGSDAAWLGRDVMQAVMGLRRNQPAYDLPGAPSPPRRESGSRGGGLGIWHKCYSALTSVDPRDASPRPNAVDAGG